MKIAVLCATSTLMLSSVVSGGDVHPVEADLQRAFPTISLRSTATFDAQPEFLSARFPGSNTLSIRYPRVYDGPLVAEAGAERVVIRAAGAHPAPAVESNGKLIYPRPYESVDAVEIPHEGRSEELLLLRDNRAPLTFDYEIVAAEGVVAVQMDDGAIWFVPKPPPPPEQNSARQRVTVRPPTLQIDRPWVIDASGKRSATAAHWTLIGEGPIPKTIRLTVEPREMIFPILVDPSFVVPGTLATARYRHTATLLPNGKILFAGGWNADYLASAELYDPSRGTFSPAGSMNVARYDHTATLLPNGKVLIAGGYNGNVGFMAFAELYDPASGTFAPTGSLITGRSNHTATLLPNGKVLIAGGYSNAAPGFYLTSAELYDPANGTFTATGSMATGRDRHTATLLQNGKVLMAGGYNSFTAPTTAELYDPATGNFTASGSIGSTRAYHTATLLPNGKVLIAGGTDDTNTNLITAKLYDPATASFTDTPNMTYARGSHTATLMPDGKVILACGWGSTGVLSDVEAYDPETGTFTDYGGLYIARGLHTATLLPSGDVLFAAGSNGGMLGSAEIYAHTWSSSTVTGSLANPRDHHTATMLPNGKVLIAAGAAADGPTRSAELYDSATGTFSSTGDLITARTAHTATLLANGKVLITGGLDTSNAALASAEIYNPATGTFTATGNLNTARYYHTATLLQDGRVLIVAGSNGAAVQNSAEIYDPIAGTFTVTGSLYDARYWHTATRLADGRVIVAGGTNGPIVGSFEIYDPATGTFRIGGSLVYPRYLHSATLLPNGKVLLAGGSVNGGITSSCDLFDPATGKSTLTGFIDYLPASVHTATLLANQQVIIAGGIYAGQISLYDPAAGRFRYVGWLTTNRAYHTATLLPDGTVLFAGGSGTAASAEIFRLGLPPPELRRPVISSIPAKLDVPGTLTIVGNGFRNDAETGSGSTQSSATNFPILQLQRLDNEQTLIVSPTSAFSDVAWSSALTSLLPGFYRASIIRNAIASQQQIIEITRATPAISGVSPNRGVISGGQIVTISGTNLGGVAVTIGGNLATVTQSSNSSVTFVTPAHAPAIVDVIVTTPAGASATAAGAYTYVPSPPANVIATAGSTTSVTVMWSASAGATAYQILRSSNGVAFDLIAGVPGTTFTDFGTAPTTAYLYVVRASAPTASDNSTPDLATTVMFTDDPLIAGMTTVKAAHLTELRTAVNAVRALAGLAAASFTDSTITPSATPTRAAHIAELRTALDAARAALLLSPVVYARPAPSPGATIFASDVNNLRSGIK